MPAENQRGPTGRSRPLLLLTLLAACSLIFVALATAPAAQARTQFVLNVTANAVDHAEGEGGVEYCYPGGEAGTSEECPLRAALEEADGLLTGFSVEEVVVALPAGHYKLTKEAALNLGSHAPGQCGLNPCAVTLRGAGTGSTVIEVAGKSIGLYVEEAVDAPVAVEGITLVGGKKGILDIAQKAHLTVRNVAITGGIDTGLVAYDSGPVDVIESSITHNATTTSGGALYSHRAHVVVFRSTLSGNSADFGGAVATAMGAGETVTIVDSTLANNTAQSGGAVWGNEIVLRQDTIAGNGPGSGIATRGGVVLEGSILAGNSPQQCEVVEGHTLAAVGPNILYGPSACPVTGSAPLALNPHLGPLAANGGPTRTMALLAGSPALDAAGTTCPTAGFEGGPPVDERGVKRPKGHGCDLGAFESRADGAVSLTASPRRVRPHGDLKLTATVRNRGAETLTGLQVTIPLPRGTSLISAPRGCSATFGPKGSVKCTVARLSPGRSHAFAVHVRPRRAGALIETAGLREKQADIKSSNNRVTIASIVGG